MRYVFAITMLVMLVVSFVGGVMICKYLFFSEDETPKHTNYITNMQSFIKTNYKTNYITNSSEIVKEVIITKSESVTNTILYKVRKDNMVGLGVNDNEGVLIYTHSVYNDFFLGAGLRFNYFTLTNLSVYVFVSYSF